MSLVVCARVRESADTRWIGRGGGGGKQWQAAYLDEVGGGAVVEAVRVDVVLPPDQVEVGPQGLLAHAVGVEVQLVLVKVVEVLHSSHGAHTTHTRGECLALSPTELREIGLWGWRVSSP